MTDDTTDDWRTNYEGKYVELDVADSDASKHCYHEVADISIDNGRVELTYESGETRVHENARVVTLKDEPDHTPYHVVRERVISKEGWIEPTDESPVPTPDQWRGGAVVNTGGNIMCRIWRSPNFYGENSPSSENEQAYEVIYGSDFSAVSINRHTPDSAGDYYTFDEEIALRKPDEKTDEACATLARELMNEYHHLTE